MPRIGKKTCPTRPLPQTPDLLPQKGGRPADPEMARRRTDDNFPASIRRAEVIGRAPQSTWCYFGARQRKNQKPDPVPLCLEIFLPDIVSLVFIMARPGYQGAKELALLPRKEDERDAGA